VDQLAEHSWSQFCYSPLITSGSAGRVQLVTLWLLSTHHPWISWQSTAGHTAVTLSLHPCVSWQSTLVTLQLLSTQHPCVSWQRTAGHTYVTLHSSPVDQQEKHSWSHFCYTPLITRGSAGHTSVTLHSSLVDQLTEYSWSQFCYSPLITRGSAGRVQLVTPLLLFIYNPWISWQSTAGHTSVTIHSSPVDQLAEHRWSHFCYSPVITRVLAGKAHWSHFGYSPLNTRV
jgi:hypothetical protein